MHTERGAASVTAEGRLEVSFNAEFGDVYPPEVLDDSPMNVVQSLTFKGQSMTPNFLLNYEPCTTSTIYLL